MKKDTAGEILKQLEDKRSRKVIFLSHCLLNENTRYQGGAFTGGMIHGVVRQIAEQHCGIVQMPCPEQLAWGGVAKRFMRFSYGLDQTRSPLKFAKGILVFFFILYSQAKYRAVAQEVVRQMRDYRDNGYAIAAIVGIDGSPTCGNIRSIDLSKGFRYHASLCSNITRDQYNEELYQKCVKEGSGLFTAILKKLMKRYKLDIPSVAHDLEREFKGIDRAPLPE